MNKTTIEWTQNGYTWNPTTGCTHVSDGCKHCYAEALSLRFGHSTKPWIKPYEEENVTLHPERLRQPFSLPKHHTEPIYVFVDSMSDLFHHLIPASYIGQVFAVMAATPHITYQVLTKRPKRMYQLLVDPVAEQAITEAAQKLGIVRKDGLDPTWPLANVWLGISVEDQRVVDRIDWLIQTPAAIRFLSVEPMIGPLDLTPWLWEEAGPVWAGTNPSPDLDWVIVGGESGPHHRPFDPQWARDIRDQCVAGGVPFFFKQWGGLTPKAGGRLLDGRTWDEMPVPAQRGQLALIGA